MVYSYMLSNNHLFVVHTLLTHGFHLRIDLVHAEYMTFWILSPEKLPGSHIRHLCQHLYTLRFPLLPGRVQVLNLKIELESTWPCRYSWWKCRHILQSNRRSLRRL